MSDTCVRATDRIDGFTWQGVGFDAWRSAIVRNLVLEANEDTGGRRRRSRTSPLELQMIGGLSVDEVGTVVRSPGRSPSRNRRCFCGSDR